MGEEREAVEEDSGEAAGHSLEVTVSVTGTGGEGSEKGRKLIPISAG